MFAFLLWAHGSKVDTDYWNPQVTLELFLDWINLGWMLKIAPKGVSLIGAKLDGREARHISAEPVGFDRYLFG